MGYAHGIKWTEDKIKQEIFRVMKQLNIERMPTKTEIEFVIGNSNLTNKISKTGGFIHWASELNLKTKNSESREGEKYELITIDKLSEKGLKADKMPVRHPYDILVEDCVKVDIKVSRRYYYTDNNYYYTFNLEKRCASCDLYIAYCIDNKENLEKTLIIPSNKLKITQLSIGEKSAYNKYIDRWDYIDKFIEFYNKIA